ncbi:MAG: bifunctional indole-3-glycerol phosphate synthase/phosphoribosylanthranilate isomerase [Spirochaetaceae bacterium]
MEAVLDRIASRRRERIQMEGPALSTAVPGARTVPIVPFLQQPALICEVKRSSPSRGTIAGEADPVEQARIYSDYGVPTVSVLTEEDHFGGSLDDLMVIKERFPSLALLRKDFLFDAADVEVSYRAGADAVLCITRMLSDRELEEILAAAGELGIAVLAEAHSEEDIKRLSCFEPSYVGINSRNLADFSVDMLIPPAIAASIDWRAQLVFESGIFYPEHIRHARCAGFDAALVGEAVMRRPEVIPQLLKEYERRSSKKAGGNEAPDEPKKPGKKEAPDEPRAIEGGYSSSYFWSRVAVKLHKTSASASSPPRPSASRPLVKICGLTRREDAEAAAGLGADILGFIFAPSQREGSEKLLHSLSHISTLKVAVLVARRSGELDEARIALVTRLLQRGYIDAVQLHGDETAEECGEIAFPYYKAVRPKSAEETGKPCRCPRVLIDAFVPDRYGGTGKRVDPDIIEAARLQGPLWLAGGINPENVVEIIHGFRPELIDISSGVEKCPGEKDPQKLKRLFEEIQRGRETLF